jgi:hypothetical protein
VPYKQDSRAFLKATQEGRQQLKQSPDDLQIPSVAQIALSALGAVSVQIYVSLQGFALVLLLA